LPSATLGLESEQESVILQKFLDLVYKLREAANVVNQVDPFNNLTGFWGFGEQYVTEPEGNTRKTFTIAPGFGASKDSGQHKQ